MFYLQRITQFSKHMKDFRSELKDDAERALLTKTQNLEGQLRLAKDHENQMGQDLKSEREIHETTKFDVEEQKRRLEAIKGKHEVELQRMTKKHEDDGSTQQSRNEEITRTQLEAQHREMIAKFAKERSELQSQLEEAHQSLSTLKD